MEFMTQPRLTPKLIQHVVISLLFFRNNVILKIFLKSTNIFTSHLSFF
jgi:hypothetical protein